jgi:hypothetical protein
MGKMVLYDIRQTRRREMAIPVNSVEAPAMRKPRVRFREFLLLITMASLVTAAFAIRARTASSLSAQDHAFHAYRARVSANWWEDRLKKGNRYLETNPLISEDRAAGCDVRLISSVKDMGEIPTRGKDLIIVAEGVDDVFYFRMFDGDGKVVVDWADAMNADNLKKQFVGLWPPHELTGIEKARVLTAVTSVVGAAVWTDLSNMQAMHAKAVAEAEYHERLSRLP